ncbi:MAG: hypothetical protein KFF50_00635 [Desulfatitalea sp.]|nr:hypothetical protein [Desulfatitalea sp.]
MKKDPATQNSSDDAWENRVLCADESCIGVIGPDGRCKECGLAYDGDWPAALEATDIPDDEHDTEASQDEDGSDAPLPEQMADLDNAPGDDEWQQRTLCSDEGCIGVIGPDGRCKECGKPYQP